MTDDARRSWRFLTGRQRHVAEDLHARMCELPAADEQPSMAEAIGIAAIEGGYGPITKPHPAGPDESAARLPQEVRE